MSVWNPHPLADPVKEALVLRPKQRCQAAVDLPGVPAGTKGVVLLANGFSWLRYRVRFDNGVELGNLDGRHLAPATKR